MQFAELHPDEIFEAVERLGERCTGRLMALNSYENRVYDIEIESGTAVIAKFYRPGRWNAEAITAEHSFLFDLEANEIPAVAPLVFPHGNSLEQTTSGIFYAVFPKHRGRIADELDHEQRAWLGRYIARIHNVGTDHQSSARPLLCPETYGWQNLNFLLEHHFIEEPYASSYQRVVEEILRLIAPLFEKIQPIRLHGDCHLGNIIWTTNGPLFVDFDDTCMGPAIQDLWMLSGSGDRRELDRNLQEIIEGYQLMRPFHRADLQLIEPLSALRMVNYAAWIARRWKDPFFAKIFPDFASPKYWSEQTSNLQDRLADIRRHSGQR